MFRPAALAALLATLALPLGAQETTDVPADDGTGGDLSLGIPVGGEPKVGDSYTAATFDQWEQRCAKTESGADPCQLYQLLRDPEGNAVAEMSIFNLPEGAEGPAVAGATFIAPLETLLTEGLRISVDGANPRAYPFTVCTQIGCVARIGFTAEEVEQFKRGAKATAIIVPFVAPEATVNLDVSLKGFTAGLEAVIAANKLADAANPPAEVPAP